MCAIVDANVATEVFSTEAGVKFAQWIDTGRGRLVAAGKLLEELEKTPLRNWIQQAINAGLLRTVSAADVEIRTAALKSTQACRSNDPHIVALAQVSGARLLYSHDRDLQSDFKNKSLIDQPRGKVYSTQENKSLLPSHTRLLARTDLCGRG